MKKSEWFQLLSTKDFIENIFASLFEIHLFLHIQKTFILHLRQTQSYSIHGLCTENHNSSVVEKWLMQVFLKQTINKRKE